ICLVVSGGLGILYWLAARARSASFPRLIWLPPLYVLFQATPLPIGLVRILSPARARLSDALAPVLTPPSSISLSVTPSATLFDSLQIASCVVVFLIVYNLACSPALLSWTVALPLIFIGAAEAGLGLYQVS